MDDNDDKLDTFRPKPTPYDIDNQSNTSNDFPLGCKVIKNNHIGIRRTLKERGTPAALLFITGGSDKYMPNETIKNQLKSGLFEIIKTTSIWIITEGKDTAVGNIVEEAILENRGTYEIRVFHKDKNYRRPKDTLQEQHQHDLENCKESRPTIPLIVIVVGGDAKSLSLAMSFLKKNDPVLAIDGSGYAADFICQGYAMSIHKIRDDDKFLSELTYTAKKIWGYEEGQVTKKTNWKKLANELKFGLQYNREFVTLDKNRGEGSHLPTLFNNALMYNRVETVKLVLEYIQDKELYKKYLDKYLQKLYTQQELKGKTIVSKINTAVIKILGSKDFKPFHNDNGKEGIRVKDVFKHFFIWAVLMDRRELAMLFWRKLDNDYIYSALYASSIAKTLAENGRSEMYVDQMTALWDSSRHYENLAYSVMTEFYYMEKSQARQLLDTQMKGYNSSTIFQITEKFTLMKFMGHAVCQTELNRIWKGHILGRTSILKLSYMTFLVVFCWFILTDLYPIAEKTPSVQEYIVYAWAASAMTEEIRQAIVFNQVSLNLMTWFSFWTLYEFVMYSMFITSVILRLTLSVDDFYYARMMLAITLGLFIINSMQFFLVSKHIGPKVIMIGRMMFDIIFFILIFAVFLFGFGVIYQATMYPNSTPGFQLFKEIIYMPYWQLYGELFLEQYEGTVN
ncbi:transient receptor potential cation channel subfamily M member 3-like [Mytilus trossulus]|uniref:transient receptor potential cation channel subfamily M member 3-like n=1 Tax=Mytilus trossulus TaxID=6551 RepID=UPI0030064EE0